MDSTTEPDPQNSEIPFSPHPTDPDGVVIPPPTPQQIAKGRIGCKVYDREEWGARTPRETPVMYTPVTKVMLSRTETDPCFTPEDCRLRVREMQNAHMDEEGEPDIKYHFLVGGDGALYEGRGYTTVGRSYPVTPNNLQDLSKNCLEIAFIQRSDKETSEEMQKTASDCISLGRYANHIYKVFDVYFVANNDIIHVQQAGRPILGDGKTQEGDSKTNSEANSENSQESSSPQLDKGASQTEVSPSTDEPDMIETGKVKEYVTHSNVPQHDSVIDEEEKNNNEEDSKPVKFIYRHEWGAEMPKWIKALNLPIKKVAVSFTETEPCNTEEECIAVVKKLQEKHLKEKKEPDIKHNFLIGGDGQIYEGRGYTRVGPIYSPSVRKIEDLNETSIDIGIIEKHAKQPSAEVVHAISWCLSTGIHRNYIEKNFETFYLANNEIIHVQHPVHSAK